MSDKIPNTKSGLFNLKEWRKKVKGKDMLQNRKWDFNHGLIGGLIEECVRNDIPVISRGYIRKRVEELRKSKELPSDYKLSSDTIWRHLKEFVKEGVLKTTNQIKGRYLIDSTKNLIANRLKLSLLKDIIADIEEGKIWGFVQSYPNPGIPIKNNLTYYEFCINPKNKMEWIGLLFVKPQDILNSFILSVEKQGLEMKNMPEKVLIAYVINTKQLSKERNKMFKKYPYLKRTL